MAVRSERRVAPALLGRRGDHRDPEPPGYRPVADQIAPTRFGGQAVGVRAAHRLPGFGLRKRAQADPVGQMGFEPADPPGVQPLGGQQQVDADRSADPADGDEQFGEVRTRAEQLGELIDDHQQIGDRFELGSGDGGAPGRRRSR